MTVTLISKNIRNQLFTVISKNTRKFGVLFFCIIFSLLFSFVITTIHVNAKPALSNRTKLYKSVLIYGGDTFTTISEKYISAEYSSSEAFIKEIKRINNLSDASSLTPGNHIIIPYYENNTELDLYDVVTLDDDIHNDDIVIENYGCPVITISHESSNNDFIENF